MYNGYSTAVLKCSEPIIEERKKGVKHEIHEGLSVKYVSQDVCATIVQKTMLCVEYNDHMTPCRIGKWVELRQCTHNKLSMNRKLA